MKKAKATRTKSAKRGATAGGGEGRPSSPAAVRTSQRGKAKPYTDADRLYRIPLEKLHDHPANPDPTAEEIEQMVTWLSRGQDEPITVRPGHTPGCPQYDPELPIGHYQVLAGRTRLAAARELGWDTIECRVRSDLAADEAAAVTFMAASNAQRRTENAHRQALMIEAMLAAGADVGQAGAVYGLTSESAVRNKLQLLKLPPKWLARVVSGEICETGARCLVPYADVPALMNALNKRFTNPYSRDWRSRSAVAEAVRNVITHETRPIEKAHKHDYGYSLGSHPRLFELDDANRIALGIVKLPLGKDGRHVERATNVRLYDGLQKPLIEAKRKAKSGKAAKTAKGKTGKAAAARAREVAAERKKVLDNKYKQWRHRMLRMQLFEAITLGCPKSELVGQLLVICGGQSRHGAYRAAPLREITVSALAHMSCDAARRRPKPIEGNWIDDDEFARLLSGAIDWEDQAAEVVSNLRMLQARFLAWPQCEAAREGEPLSRELVDDKDLPPLCHKLVEHCAGLVGASIEDGWRRGAIHGSRERPLVREFFAYHHRAELQALGPELLGPIVGQLAEANGQKVSEQVDLVLSFHTGDRPLKLPKCLRDKSVRRKR